MRRDALKIEDLMVYAQIGITKEERAHPQRLLVSVSVTADLTLASSSGEVSQGICYAQLAEHIQDIVKEREWQLVEQLSDTLIAAIFGRYDAATDVTITLKKFAVPNCAWVGVESFRSR